MMRRFLPMLLVGTLASAADTVQPMTLVVEETITGTDPQGGDAEELGRIARLERERITRAREEMPRLGPTLTLVARQDIGSAEAELTRVLVSSGETASLGRRTFTLAPGRIEVDDGSRRITVDLAAREATDLSAEEPRKWKVLAPGEQRPLVDGRPGRAVNGRETVAFSCKVDNAVLTVLVDPTLPNPFSSLRLDGAEDDALSRELARLPGFPLLVEQPGDRVVRRWTVVEIR